MTLWPYGRALAVTLSVLGLAAGTSADQGHLRALVIVCEYMSKYKLFTRTLLLLNPHFQSSNIS
jgi:hypothetical protein